MSQLSLFEPADTSTLRGYLSTLGRVESEAFPGARFWVLPIKGPEMWCEAASVEGVAAAKFKAIVMELET